MIDKPFFIILRACVLRVLKCKKQTSLQEGNTAYSIGVLIKATLNKIHF